MRKALQTGRKGQSRRKRRHSALLVNLQTQPREGEHGGDDKNGRMGRESRENSNVSVTTENRDGKVDRCVGNDGRLRENAREV